MLQRLLERTIETSAFVCAKARGAGIWAYHQVDQWFTPLLPANPVLRKRAIVGLFSLPVLGAVAAIASVDNAPTAAFQQGAQDAVVEAIELNLSEQQVFYVAPLVSEEKVRRGESLADVLRRMGVSTVGLTQFIKHDPVASQLTKLKAGRIVSVQLNAMGELVWLRYKSGLDEDSLDSILIQRTNAGYLAKKESVLYDKQVVFKAGRIDSTLFAAADKAGLPDSVAVQLTEIFGSEIDFHRELKNGDEFRVVYEDYLVDGRSARTGRILAVEFINSGRSYRAYWFSANGYPSGYFDENGRSLRKSFLRSPLAVSRITSGFSRRFHPILGRWQAHEGVDYAAPTGTPVMATASGTVKSVGSQSGYGNIVEIQHHSNYSTAYAHLSAFARGIHKGQKVEQGQIIGFVGSTGWATGPHLHYEFRIGSVPKDPLTVDVAHNIPLQYAALEQFKRQQLSLDRRMQLASQTRLASAQ